MDDCRRSAVGLPCGKYNGGWYLFHVISGMINVAIGAQCHCFVFAESLAICNAYKHGLADIDVADGVVRLHERGADWH